MSEITSLARTVAEFRRFSRFYRGYVDALTDRIRRGPLSEPQARVLNEIASGPKDLQAADIARALRMDAGQLSRVLASIEDAGLIDRAPTTANTKRLHISLTQKGETVVHALNEVINGQISTSLRNLSGENRTRLVRAMRLVMRTLGERAHPSLGVELRDLEPGDLGWVISRQAELYAAEYGWNAEYEALAASILANFARDHDPECERGWIAEIDGDRVGAVFMMRKDATTAQLRLLHVEMAARGRGAGSKLVEAVLSSARAAGYGRVELWTNDVLVSARRIYIDAGFTLISEEAHTSFGQNLNGQTWARDL
ncbi:MAG: bifunctional helix-turn-helix transcriptional regulator/GNAT family N-acetyltransferase [Pseudooceanicola sp.]